MPWPPGQITPPPPTPRTHCQQNTPPHRTKKCLCPPRIISGTPLIHNHSVLCEHSQNTRQCSDTSFCALLNHFHAVNPQTWWFTALINRLCVKLLGNATPVEQMPVCSTCSALDPVVGKLLWSQRCWFDTSSADIGNSSWLHNYIVTIKDKGPLHLCYASPENTLQYFMGVTGQSTDLLCQNCSKVAWQIK